ncbi:MAG: hypothetical protein HUJ22_02295 [Gracilimonas sp.]|uniref:DUF5677 domain-containing protein n=1 Tax=Gracilimonas sp. TaxID=1974203 RepID=UPI0019864B48|nr:DUF5677 domain-containing protein [Gracilimonas sp.]MBD3615375.1 hypothetical protein [Gracilimonas sp.]
MTEPDYEQIDVLISRLIKTVDDSFKNEPQGNKETFFWGLYFSLLELSQESIRLISEKRYELVAIACRNSVELYMDVYNCLKYDDYIDRLLLTSFSKQIKLSEFIFKEKKEFDEKTLNRERDNIAYAKKQKALLKKRGVTNIYGIAEKYKLSNLTQFPLMFWMIDMLNQEVHADLRLMMERYSIEDKIPRDFNKGYISPYRNSKTEITVNNYLNLFLAGICESTSVILKEKKLLYSNSIEVIINQLKDILSQAETEGSGNNA